MSKSDQLRAMRERLVADREANTIEITPKRTTQALKNAKMPIVTKERAEKLSVLAPVGQCPHCDQRRAKQAERMKAWRQRKKST